VRKKRKNSKGRGVFSLLSPGVCDDASQPENREISLKMGKSEQAPGVLSLLSLFSQDARLACEIHPRRLWRNKIVY